MILCFIPRWIKSKSNDNENRIEDRCPSCRVSLKREFVDQALETISDPIQCKIAFEAWNELGGDPDDFPNPPEQCCEKLDIQCDADGNILELNWPDQGLDGILSPKLGNLTRLEKL